MHDPGEGPGDFRHCEPGAPAAILYGPGCTGPVVECPASRARFEQP